MKILFIGAGNMGQALISGILKKKLINPNDVFIFEINKETENKVIKKYKIKTLSAIDSTLSEFNIIVLAIKPQVYKNFNQDPQMVNIKNYLKKEQLIISIMAGISLNSLIEFFGNRLNIIRTMPNTPALIGEAMTVISPVSDISSDSLNLAKKIFESIGKVEVLEEKYMDAVTGLSGSGPAYVFTFIEAMTQGGVLCGLSKTIAEKLAIQTILGACKMLKSNETVEELRHKVTSPGGTTIEGLVALEKNNFRASIIEAIKSATNKSSELSRK